MRPWFHSEERRAALWTEQERWIGTPFFPRAASIGRGVDCVHLQHEILSAIGAIPRLTLPSYAIDRGKHCARSQLIVFLMTTEGLAGRLVFVPPSKPKLPGDLIGLRSGRADHHLASVDPWEHAVHAVEDAGVVRTPLNDAELMGRVLYVLRLMENTRS